MAVEECTKADEFIKEFPLKVPLSLDEAASEFESELGCSDGIFPPGGGIVFA